MELNKVYNENCLDTMARMEDNFIDLIVTSPPYNMLTQAKYNKYIRRVHKDHKSNKYNSFDDGLKIDDFYDLHCSIMDEMLRVSKIVIYNFQIVTGSKEAFFKMIGKYNKEIKDIIVWDKKRCLPASREGILNAGYELILIMEGDKHLGRTIKNATFKRCGLDNILRIERKKAIINGEKHNAVYPELLCDILIKSFSNKGDLVYDPFSGTGTTQKVAKTAGRSYLGSEIDKKYCDLIGQRLNDMGGLF